MVKKINKYFETATRADVNNLLSKIILSERQTRIFEMFYLRDMNINFIADTVGCSPSVVSVELKIIREKIEKAMTD